ncbi:MAG TPA: hypothetical protein VFR18_16555 [Terriglobia bacterium]|nr:hypothetical protein [Terriglobia bacterium]
MMKLLTTRNLAVAFLVLAFSSQGFAQKYEIHPLVGRNAPDKWADLYSLKSVAIVGVKAAVFATDNTQIEGEFEYLPHFEFRGTDPEMRAWVWGFSITRNIFLEKSKVVPFFHFGVGGVTARSDASVTTVLPDRTVTIDNNDTFTAINYGVGVKAYRVFGPVGLRANVLGRTMPNFFGRGNSWAEFSGGPVFSWGKR